MAGTITCLGRMNRPKVKHNKSKVKYMMKDVYKYMLVVGYFHSTRVFIKTKNKYVYKMISLIEIEISKYYPLAWE